MGRKLFSQIYDERVTLGAGTKRIPAEDFSQLQSVEELLQDCEAIREKVQQDAKAYRQQVSTECEQEREKAQQDGFLQGMERWSEQLLLLEKKIEVAESEMKRLVVPVALKAARKIVGREIQLSEETIIDIVQNSLRGVASHEYVTVFVNRQSLDLLNASKDRLKSVFDRLQSLTIAERDDIEPGSCVIETEAGIINAEIENQWTQLESVMLRMVEESSEVGS